MKIAVIGTGAMGSVYAALLGAAGHDVWAIDSWPEHIEAIRKNGLRLEGASGDRTVKVHASTRAADAGVCDLVIIATKAMHVAQAAESAKPILARIRSSCRFKTAWAVRIPLPACLGAIA
jgi:2-dehydropantoate 2-reductase